MPVKFRGIQREDGQKMGENRMNDTEELSNYLKYRGKCKELCEQAIKEDPTLTLVRGHYFCFLWETNEPHWWTVRQDGTIYDPSALQFPDKGQGIYKPFDGYVECSQCGDTILEQDASFNGNYAFCSGDCFCRFVGL